LRRQWEERGDDSWLCKPAKEREGDEPARRRGARCMARCGLWPPNFETGEHQWLVRLRQVVVGSSGGKKVRKGGDRE
jgi:hypothetical protein